LCVFIQHIIYIYIVFSFGIDVSEAEVLPDLNPEKQVYRYREIERTYLSQPFSLSFSLSFCLSHSLSRARSLSVSLSLFLSLSLSRALSLSRCLALSLSLSDCLSLSVHVEPKPDKLNLNSLSSTCSA
jgi:hypothetical protein